MKMAAWFILALGYIKEIMNISEQPIIRSKPNIKLEDYLLPAGLSDKQVMKRLKCPITRICNIYMIINAEAEYVPFRPNPAQMRIIEMIYIEGVRRLCIPKSRQRGVSTILSIICVDQTYFSQDRVRAGIIDLTHGDAKDKIKKCRDALEGLPESLKPKSYEPDSTETIGFPNGADIITKNIRGKTVQFLFVSEFGKICFKDDERAKEIQSGAFKAASGKSSIIVCESTFYGGKQGQFYNYIQEGITTPEHFKTELSWHVVFFPWHEKPENRLKGDIRSVEFETMKYLKEKEDELGIKFDSEQKIWYAQEKRTQGLWVYREEPTTIDECWKAPIEGSIYGDEFSKSAAQGKIYNFEFQAIPTYASFDLGGPMNTVCWLWQVKGPNLYALRAWGRGICRTQKDWVEMWREAGIKITGIYLPHDGDTKHSSGVSARQGFIDADPKLKVITVERTAYFRSAWDDINYGGKIWPQIHFHKDGTQEGREWVELFRTKSGDNTNVLSQGDERHWADGMQTFFQAHGQGLVPTWEDQFQKSPFRKGDDEDYPWSHKKSPHGRIRAKSGFRLL